MITTVPVHDEDEGFLFELYVSVRLADFAGAGISDAELEALLLMQYEAQRSSYARRYPDARHLVVKDGDAPIGRAIVAETDEAIQLVDLALLKPYRGKGIGSILIRRLQKEAALVGKPMRLQVAMDNPAMRLYQRLGFRPMREQFHYLTMEWNPKAEKSVAASLV
jgi:ribosomal protein S18 acetylase RimI-like enzyme